MAFAQRIYVEECEDFGRVVKFEGRYIAWYVVLTELLPRLEYGYLVRLYLL